MAHDASQAFVDYDVEQDLTARQSFGAGDAIANIIPFPGEYRPTHEQSPPFTGGWERALDALRTDNTPEAIEALAWLEEHKQAIGEIEASGDALLTVNQFDEAYHYQLAQEKNVAEIRTAEQYRSGRFHRPLDPETVPTRPISEHAWVGTRYVDMLYMSHLLHMKGHTDPVYNTGGDGFDHYQNFGDLADMVYPDMLFNGRYPQSGQISRDIFDQTTQDTADWQKVNWLRQQYEEAHLSNAPGNTEIRWKWSAQEKATAADKKVQILEELRHAYGDAPEGLDALTVDELKQVRLRYGRAIKDRSVRQNEMELEYLDNRLAWVHTIFDDEASENPAHALLEQRLEKDLVFIVASALQSTKQSQFDHTDMIKQLIQARQNELVVAEHVHRTSLTSIEEHVRLATLHVHIAETFAIEYAKQQRKYAILQQLSRQATLYAVAS